MTMISNFIFNWFIPGAEGILMGLGMLVTFETVKGIIYKAYKRHQIFKFKEELRNIRNNK